MRKRTLGIVLSLAAFLGADSITASGKTVLATTFPIYQVVRHIVQGREGVKVDLLLPSQMGCPHNYALTPQDMQKLSWADILVINGIGMEEFLGAPVKRANSRIRVIDSSTGIREVLFYSKAQHSIPAQKGVPTERGPEHPHADVNPHLFVSPRMQAKIAMNIAEGLSVADPDGKVTYFKNARDYAGTMNLLADEMEALGKRFQNNRIVQTHEAFDYLARDMGLRIIAVLQIHGQEPSASRMIRLIASIREQSAGAILSEPQYPGKIGKVLSKETGIPVVLLDPVATGPENAPLDYYETVMRQNMKILESTMPGR